MRVDLTERRLKEMAKTLRAGLPEDARPSYAQTLDLMATAFGHRTFAAMKAKLGDRPQDADGDVRAYTVLVCDQRDGGRTYSVHEVEQTDAENAGAVARIAAVQDEFPAQPFDDETQARWEHAMRLVNPVMTLAGAPAPRETARLWTVAVRWSKGSRSGYEVAYVQTDDPKQAESRAQTDLRWTLFGVDGLWADDKPGMEMAAVLPGRLIPEDEDAENAELPDPETPQLVLEMQGGVVQAIVADRPMRVIRIDEDELEDVPLSDDPEENRREIEDRVPEWGTVDAVETPAQVAARGDAHAARFRAELTRDLLDETEND